MVFVAAAGPEGKPRPALATFFAGQVSSSSVRVFPAGLTRAFISEGLFSQAFMDAAGVVLKLELHKTADFLILAREKAEYIQNDSSLANVLTANTVLEVLILPTKTPARAETKTFIGKGAGFNKLDALLAAEERIMKQITNGNPITLPSLP